MAYDEKKKAKIRADFEAGKLSQRQMAQKWRISRNTLLKFAKEGEWGQGKNEPKINQEITARATEQIIQNETKNLFDYTTKHLSQLDLVRKLTNINLNNIAAEFKAAQKEGKKPGKERQIPKSISEDSFSLQRFLELAGKTLKLAYADERLAMGLDKEEESKTINIELVNYAEADDSI